MKAGGKYRNNGAIGALLDEYEKAIFELKEVIKSLSDLELRQIVDPKATDKDCVSIQSILSHVVRAGYNYVIAIRKWKGESLGYRQSDDQNSTEAYLIELNKMFDYNVALFEDYPSIKLEEYDNAKKINVSWGQQYDVEQLYEHAIVHVLRHRRQIERFKLGLEQ